jgi:uncharacterized membrane protein YfcA
MAGCSAVSTEAPQIIYKAEAIVGLASPAPQAISIRPSWRQHAAQLVLLASVVLLAAAGPRLGSPSALVMVAILFAAFTSSIVGFAFPAICGAILFHIVAEPVLVVQIIMVCGIVNQAAMTWSMRGQINWREVSIFLAGGMTGLPVGVWLLLHAGREFNTKGLGVLLLLYGSSMLVRQRQRIARQHWLCDALAGFLGGITGGAAGFPSVAVMIWCSFKGWDKVRQRALYQPFILVMQATGLLVISLTQQQAGHGAGLEPAILLCIPASLLGTALGQAVFHRLSMNQFALAANVILAGSGLSFLL